jgi:hypothetical protein
MKNITAPFTQEQIVYLNQFQVAGVMHPFTCRDHIEVSLVATESGWICPTECDYTQNWAHDFMADGSAVRDLTPPPPPSWRVGVGAAPGTDWQAQYRDPYSTPGTWEYNHDETQCSSSCRRHNKPDRESDLAQQVAEAVVTTGRSDEFVSMIQQTEMRAALVNVERAAESDSNDAEIDALTNALDLALARWPEIDRDNL